MTDPTRRRFLAGSAALTGAVTVLPFAARADLGAGDTFSTPGGDVVVYPISHASFVMETPLGRIAVDPTGDPEIYRDTPWPDLVLVTHEHGDHYAPELLELFNRYGSQIVVNPAVSGMLPEGLRHDTLANGETLDWRGRQIRAIPAYNTTEGRLNFHPEGRDNGYVIDLPGFRVYVSGDTEDIPEMRALEEIDLAFVSMNLPFTMSAEQAASAVAEFRPAHVYPYHYRGRDGGTQDPEDFATLVGDASDVRFGAWYEEGELG